MNGGSLKRWRILCYVQAFLVTLLSPTLLSWGGVVLAQTIPFRPSFKTTDEALTIFVTSPLSNAAWGSGTALPNGPLLAAQEICNRQAQAAKLPGTWYPLISSSTWDAVNVTGTAGRGAIYNIRGDTIATNRKALWSGILKSPIRYQADGVAVSPTSPSVVTGTNPLGVRTANSSWFFCNDYTSKSFSGVMKGYADDARSGWIASTGLNKDCGVPSSIYCVSNYHANAVATPTPTTTPTHTPTRTATVTPSCTPTATPTRNIPFIPSFNTTDEALTIFVTSPLSNAAWGSGTALPNGPLLAAQEICNRQAQAAKLPGTWYPLISSSTWDAVNVTGTAGRGAIYNIRGDTIATNRKALWSGILKSPIRYQADGVAVSPTSPSVVTGTNPLGVRTANSSWFFCNDYTSKSFSGVMKGYADDARSGWIASTGLNKDCGVPSSIYCVSNYHANAVATPTPTTTPTHTPTRTATVTPSRTPTATPTSTASPSRTPTATPTSTASPAVTPTMTPAPASTNTPIVTPTNTPARTATSTPTRTPTVQETDTPTRTPTTTPTASPSPTSRATQTPTASQTSPPTPTSPSSQNDDSTDPSLCNQHGICLYPRVPVPSDLAPLAGVDQVALAPYRACALKLGLGTSVNCWGESLDVVQSEPYLPFSSVKEGLTGVTKQITLGERHSCVLQGDGVKCWSPFKSAAIGGGAPDSFVPGLGIGSGVTAVSAGAGHTCVIQQGGLKCWGDEAWVSAPGCVLREVSGGFEVDTREFIFQADAGDFDFNFDAYSIPDRFRIEDQNGTILNQSDGFISDDYAKTIFKPLGITKIKITVEGSEDGTAWEYALSCLKESSAPSSVQTFIPGFGASSGVTALSSGDQSVCVVQNGGVKCFGMDLRFGDGASYVPGLGAGSRVYAVAAPRSRSEPVACAIQNSGLKCWGFNEDDEAIGSASSYIPGLEADTGVASVSIGSRYICVVQQGGIKCSTEDDPFKFSIIPKGFGANNNVEGVATSEDNVCIIQAAGVHCFGDGELGQLGHGVFESSESPVKVKEIRHGTPCWASVYDATEEEFCSSFTPFTFKLGQLHDPTIKMRCAIDDSSLSVDITGLLGPGYPGPMSKDRIVCLLEKKKNSVIGGQTIISPLWRTSEPPLYLPWDYYKKMITSNDCSSITMSMHSHSSPSLFAAIVDAAVRTNIENHIDVPLHISQTGCSGTTGASDDLFIAFVAPLETSPLISSMMESTRFYNSQITVTGNQYMSTFDESQHAVYSVKQSPLRVFFSQGKVSGIEALWPCPQILETFSYSSQRTTPSSVCYEDRTPEKGNSRDGTSSTDIYRLDCIRSTSAIAQKDYATCSVSGANERFSHLLQRNAWGDRLLTLPLK